VHFFADFSRYLIQHLGCVMQREWISQWESMTIDELFELHQLMQAVLREKLAAKRETLENRLRQLNQLSDVDRGKARRP
jgi:predicted Fe-S protein YdhL (DUF1289 family)